MIHLVARRIRQDQRESVRAWLQEVDGPRRAEALESIAAEGIEHETSLLLETSDGPIIVYAMQTDDLTTARAVGDESLRSIDAEHRAVMRTADDGPVAGEIILDLRPE
ncbi:DUF6176 family protein [Microbacterium sp. DT81.1]|uniref:DUF6176 family protein n=1 Tax=Microbacterium sp. DT81.1 TaxID=3393413 RepID=UPI003CF46373